MKERMEFANNFLWILWFPRTAPSQLPTLYVPAPNPIPSCTSIELRRNGDVGKVILVQH
jgi:hypothetical protein